MRPAVAPDEELAGRVSAVMPCETDEDGERLVELLGPLTIPELVALVEALRRRGAWTGSARGAAYNDPSA